MSQNSVVNSTSNFLQVQTDLSKIFLWNNRYENDGYTNNSSYDPITLSAGTLMGRIASTNILVPCTSTASDGSQYPVGVLAQDVTLASGVSQTVSICVAGDVAQDKIIFAKPGDGLETVVSSRRYKDRIGADTVGIKLVPSTDNTIYDNQ